MLLLSRPLRLPRILQGKPMMYPGLRIHLVAVATNVGPKHGPAHPIPIERGEDLLLRPFMDDGALPKLPPDDALAQGYANTS